MAWMGSWEGERKRARAHEGSNLREEREKQLFLASNIFLYFLITLQSFKVDFVFMKQFLCGNYFELFISLSRSADRADELVAFALSKCSVIFEKMLKMSWQISHRKKKYIDNEKKLTRRWTKCLMTFESVPERVFQDFLVASLSQRFFRQSILNFRMTSSYILEALKHSLSSQFQLSTDGILRLQETHFAQRASTVILEDYSTAVIENPIRRL